MQKMSDIYWLSGLLEGEGSFGTRNNKCFRRTPVIQLKMTDRDIVQRVADLFNKNVRGPYNYGNKDVYSTDLCGQPAIEWMLTLYTLMGSRRQGRIQEVLEYWRETPVRGANLTTAGGRTSGKTAPKKYS